MSLPMLHACYLSVASALQFLHCPGSANKGRGVAGSSQASRHSMRPLHWQKSGSRGWAYLVSKYGDLAKFESKPFNLQPLAADDGHIHITKALPSVKALLTSSAKPIWLLPQAIMQAHPCSHKAFDLDIQSPSIMIVESP